MEKSPAFQFYPNNWLGSSKVGTMTPAEEGAYIRLLCYAWNEADGGLPDDDATLARLSRLGKHWKRSSQKILSCFTKENGRLFNSRLSMERNKQIEFRAKASLAGKKSAMVRAIGSKVRSPDVQQLFNEPSTLQSSSSSSFSDTNVSHRIPKDKKSVIGKTFEAPELKEIAEYFSEQTQNRWTEKEIKMQSNKFFNYYTSNGWKVGKNAMKDWHATARNWILDKQPEQSKALSTKNNFSNETFTAI